MGCAFSSSAATAVADQPRPIDYGRAVRACDKRLAEPDLKRLVDCLEACHLPTREERQFDKLAGLLTIISHHRGSSPAAAAVGAVVRASGRLPQLAELMTFQASRQSALQALRMLTTDEYDAAGAAQTRAALDGCDALRTVLSFVYLSPTAQCGSIAEGPHHARKTVFLALQLLTNLVSSRDHAAACFAGRFRLEELATDPDTPRARHPVPWATAEISAAAQRCLRNMNRVQDAEESVTRPRSSSGLVRATSWYCRFEQAPLHETEPGQAPMPPRPPPRMPPTTYARTAPTTARGFHDFSAPLSLASLPLVPHTAVADAEMCTVCLEEFVPGEQLRVLPCLHRFHPNCIDCWVQSRAVGGRGKLSCKCPNCNQAIVVQ